MTDTPLRKAIQGTDADSVWRIPRRREEAFGIDLVAMDLAQPGGGDGDGGDGGD